MRYRLNLIAFVLLALLTVGCAVKSAAVRPPAVVLTDSMNILGQSLKASQDAINAAAASGKISKAAQLQADAIGVMIANTGLKIDAELRSTVDDWPTQKFKIISLVGESGLSAAVKKLPPDIAALLQVAVNSFNQISASLGGPTI